MLQYLQVRYQLDALVDITQSNWSFTYFISVMIYLLARCVCFLVNSGYKGIESNAKQLGYFANATFDDPLNFAASFNAVGYSYSMIHIALISLGFV